MPIRYENKDPKPTSLGVGASCNCDRRLTVLHETHYSEWRSMVIYYVVSTDDNDLVLSVM